MRRCPRWRASLLFVSVCTSAAADGGYGAGSKGARVAGRAGAFVAKADDIMAVHYNPAGLARIDGTLLQGGNRFSYNAHSFERQATLDWGNTVAGNPPYVSFAEVSNETPWQLVDPLLGVASDLGLRDWGFALVVYAPPGVGKQEFPVDGGQRYMMVSREAELIDTSLSAAWKYQESFGAGLSLQWLYLRKLDYQLVIDANLFPGDVNPVSSELDMLSTLSGSDRFIFNAILGAWYRPAPFLELGVSGQLIPTSMKTQSTLDVKPLNPSAVADVELTRDGQPADDVTLELPLPLTFRAGVRYVGLSAERELYDVELDLVYETWSRVERFTMDGDGLVATFRGQPVDIGLIEIEKQWQDTLGVHLGGDVEALPDLLVARGGLFYETAVADESYANVDFASGKQLGFGLGTSWFVGGLELALGYEFRYQPPVTVSEDAARVYQEVPASQCEPPYTDPNFCHPEYQGQPAPPVNAGTYQAHSHFASLDVLYRF